MIDQEHEDYLDLLHECLLHRYRYYVLSSPAVSDAWYDVLERKLKAYEQTNPDKICKYSPTQTVGSDKAEDYPMPVQSHFRNGRK